MSKIAVIFWSGTGNTQMMAEEIGEGAKAEVFNVSDFNANINDYDQLIFGCPSTGAEELEYDEFEPFFSGIEASLKGKKIALFGSYGWGDGEWMRNWEERASSVGANLFESGLIINETPDEKGLEECRAFGERFLSF